MSLLDHFIYFEGEDGSETLIPKESICEMMGIEDNQTCLVSYVNKPHEAQVQLQVKGSIAEIMLNQLALRETEKVFVENARIEQSNTK